jgi:hypothetical protein
MNPTKQRVAELALVALIQRGVGEEDRGGYRESGAAALARVAYMIAEAMAKAADDQA